MMKAAVYRGPRDIRSEQVPIPEIGDEDLLVKVMAVGICGSDLHRYLGELPLPIGAVMGHEFSGVVEKLGSGITNFEIGDRVVVNGLLPCHKCKMCRLGYPNLCSNMGVGMTGAYAEYVKVSGKVEIIKFSENVPFEVAQFAEPLSVAARTVRKAKIDFNDIVLIEGAGAVGLLILSVVKTLPTRFVIVTDVSEKRLGIARQLGADYCINTEGMTPDQVVGAVGKITGISKHGSYHISPEVDVVIEAAGAPVTTELAFRLVRGGGRIVITAYVSKPVTINPNILPQKEISIDSTFAYVNEYPQAMSLMESGKLNLKPIVSHTYSFDEAKEAFEMQMNKKEAVKVIFKP